LGLSAVASAEEERSAAGANPKTAAQINKMTGLMTLNE
jgi:hypothetical protein